MNKCKLLCVFVIVNCVICCGSDIFHQKSKITFHPDSPSSYFGYTVVLTKTSLLVGAPKATSRVKDSITPGLVFTCKLSNLDQSSNITCYPLGMDDSDHDKSIRRVITVKDFFRNDMWFGATIAAIPEDKLIICAPRWADPYKDKHLLANGACYVETRRRGMTLMPLKDQYRLAFKTDGTRKEYGEYGTHLNFYAYGQAGMSIKVTENNSIIIGAPGLMQWTGGIIDYKYTPDPNSVFFSKQPISNPYFTKELGPDDYFGYSVESGIFEVNGSTLYVAGAPRGKMGYGQVLIFEPVTRDTDPLNIRAKVRGPQLGSYFGATLCCTDLNGDGRSDLLVGAPNFVKGNGEMPYDEGAVFIYLAGGEGSTLLLEETGLVSGIGESGARFGSAIAALGDIDGDGFKDVAIGAPWENDGIGAVYIYRGSPKGLRSEYAQRIIVEDARGFGISISRGVDIDGNNCNDLAVGAHESNTTYLYRSVPTIKVHAFIKVPDAMNLPKNATNFSALFCVNVPPEKSWPHVKIDLIATITLDPENNRVTAGNSEYTIHAKPGNNACDEQVVEVKPTADLSKPILMMLDLKPKDPLLDDLPTFHREAARLSEDSTLHTSFLIQLIRDCGEDLICTPLLIMTLEAFDSLYTPGSNTSLGASLTVFNKEEPAYGAKVYIYLPLPPKRVPGSCSLEGLNMTCDVPAPLERGDSITWDIELEYALKTVDEEILNIKVELKDPLYSRNISQEPVKSVIITVKPVANFSISGKALPNATIAVTREKYYEAVNLSFVHYFEITNFGPSDWSNLVAEILLPENVSLTKSIKGCEDRVTNLTCTWSLPAKVTLPLALSLKYDLAKYGKYLEENRKINETTTLFLLSEERQNISVTTVLALDPAAPIWPHIVGSVAGVVLLAAIVFGLYKYGFFSRRQRDALKKLQEDSGPADEDAGCSSTCPPSLTDADESTQELISDDSD